LGVGNYCYDALGAGAPAGGGEGRGHIVSPRAQLVRNLEHWLKAAVAEQWPRD